MHARSCVSWCVVMWRHTNPLLLSRAFFRPPLFAIPQRFALYRASNTFKIYFTIALDVVNFFVWFCTRNVDRTFVTNRAFLLPLLGIPQRLSPIATSFFFLIHTSLPNLAVETFPIDSVGVMSNNIHSPLDSHAFMAFAYLQIHITVTKQIKKLNLMLVIISRTLLFHFHVNYVYATIGNSSEIY